MNESEKQKRADARKKRKRRQMFIGRMIIVVLLFIILGLCAFLGKDMLEKKKLRDNREQAATSAESESTADTAGTESAAETETQAQKKEDDIMSQAELKAAQYDYDGAIELLKASSDFADSQDMQDKVAEYEQAKSELVEYPLDQVTHVFYHTLIYDTSKAFDGDSKEAGYNQVMTTIDEFNKITQSMYDKGYVMVSLHDMCTVNEDGTVSPGKIMLPPGKKAFVLSQDDVSYYHYMDGDGMATKLIVDENGDIIPSVRFWGVLGPEKKQILQNTKVGIPNPGGIGETFGYTAVEMQLEGCLVTTIKNCGYMDTVYDRNMLYTDIKDLSSKIVSLLKHNGNDMSQVREYVKCNFSMAVVGEKWYELLQDVHTGKPMRHDPVLVNRNFQLKWLREINRKMKLLFPFLPTVAFYQYYCYRLREKLCFPFYKTRLPVDYDKY